MPNVSFQDPWYAKKLTRAEKPSLLTRMVIKSGLAQTTAEAQRLLLVLGIGLLGIAMLHVVLQNEPGETPQPPPDYTSNRAP